MRHHPHMIAVAVLSTFRAAGPVPAVAIVPPDLPGADL